MLLSVYTVIDTNLDACYNQLLTVSRQYYAGSLLSLRRALRILKKIETLTYRGDNSRDKYKDIKKIPWYIKTPIRFHPTYKNSPCKILENTTYHIYAKDRVLYYNLPQEEFEEKWELLQVMVGLLKTDYTERDLSYIKLKPVGWAGKIMQKTPMWEEDSY